MKKAILVSFCFLCLEAVRDPFSPRKHSYYYTAYGLVHPSGKSLGVIWIDTISYCVRLHDRVAGHTVSALLADHLILRDPKGVEWKVIKNPSTCDKLKG